jgi:hypothetical protein
MRERTGMRTRMRVRWPNGGATSEGVAERVGKVTGTLVRLAYPKAR